MLINKFIDDCQVPVEGSEKNRVVEFGQLEYCANEEDGKEKRIVNPFSEDLKPQKVDVMIEQNNLLDLQFCQSKKQPTSFSRLKTRMTLVRRKKNRHSKIITLKQVC